MSSVQPSFYFDQPTNTVDALRRSIANRLVYAIGKDVRAATSRDWLFAILYAVRDRIMDSWRESVNTAQEQDAKRVYYLSMEFLTGRMLTNALMAIGIYDDTKIACAQLGADFDGLLDMEADPGLGNGGLGRLAACFLDSIATLGLPGMGYGIRYDYGSTRSATARPRAAGTRPGPRRPGATTCTNCVTTLNATPSAARSFTPSTEPVRCFASFEYFE